jgi:hypothetical protein
MNSDELEAAKAERFFAWTKLLIGVAWTPLVFVAAWLISKA